MNKFSEPEDLKYPSSELGVVLILYWSDQCYSSFRFSHYIIGHMPSTYIAHLITPHLTILMKSTNHEALQYVIFSSLPVLCSYVQIFSSDFSSFCLHTGTTQLSLALLADRCVYPTLALSRAQLN